MKDIYLKIDGGMCDYFMYICDFVVGLAKMVDM